MSEEKKPKLKLTSLWVRTLPSGTKVISGMLGECQISIWPNQYKNDNPKAPDFVMFLEPKFEPKTKSSQFGPDPKINYNEEIPF
jgi:hypothetical protein